MSEPLQLSEAEYARLVPVTDENANKYTRGTVLVVGGSAAYPGAAILASIAASRSGAGYVRLCTTSAAAQVARCHLLSIPVSACGRVLETFDASAADEVLSSGEKSDVFVVGPGLTRSSEVSAFLARLFDTCSKPMVIDADALNAIAERPDMLKARKDCANVLTPHAGEAARLLGRPADNASDCAQELAELYNAVVVLKGHETVVAQSGRQPVVCTGAGPELAKAGTGDVLAGMIGAFAAQGLGPFDAACLAVHLHGRAAALAARELSVLSVMPEDVIDRIGPAVVNLCATAACMESESQ